MKNHYLAALISASALATAVFAAPAQELQRVSVAQNVKTNKIVKPQGEVKTLAPGIVKITDKGLKRIENRLGDKKMRAMAVRRAPLAKAPVEGSVLYESFEGWDGQDNTWLPDGWQRESTIDNLFYSWTPSPALPQMGIYPTDGDYMFAINYSDDAPQDEWLISPLVDVQQGMVVKFNAYMDVQFFFNLDDKHVDWETMSFVGEPVVNQTVQVLAKAEGDNDWTLLHDFAEELKDMSLNDILLSMKYNFETKTVALGDFGGKKAQIAIRYKGQGGNAMFIDEVAVTLPSFEGLTYMEPLCTQYWGFERNPELSCFSNSVAQMPVYEPLYWTNMAWAEGAEYIWTYLNNSTGEMVTSNDPNGLEITFKPDYTSPSSCRNNFTLPVELQGTAPGTSGGTYKPSYDLIQAGGKFEYVLRDGSTMEGGLMPFDFRSQQVGITVESVDKFGDWNLPVFGYNENTDQYWLDYTLNGSEAGEDDFVKMDAICNLVYPAEAPTVVSAADVFAKGEIADDVELTLAIYALGEDMYFDPDAQTPVAKATCKGADILRDDLSGGYNTSLCIPFDFETPVVLQASAEVSAYMVLFTGFNNPGVKYFAPLQSMLPDVNYMCMGWICKHIKVQSDVVRFSTTPMAYYKGEYGDCFNAFAIDLYAEQPWLTTEATEIVLPADGTAAEVALGSYYDGSKLTVEAPAGVEASAAGRYNECVLTLKKNDAAVEVEGDVKVTAPGLSLSIPVKSTSGIGSIERSNAAVTDIFDIAGRRIDATKAKAGVYIIKRADGSVTKTVVKQ